MANQTNFSILDDSGYPPIFLVCERISAFLILIENMIVAVCLFTHRTKFRKKEFWLQLVCLDIHDLFAGITMLVLSYLRFKLNDELLYCSILWLIISANEMALLCNILGICFYRLLFLIKSGRFRCGWTTKMTLVQIIVSLIISIIYSGVPYILNWPEKDQIAECSVPELFRSNRQTFGLYMGIGFFVPLLCTDMLYSTLLCKLRLILKKTTSKDEEINLGQLNLDENCQELLPKDVMNTKAVNSKVSRTDKVGIWW